MRPTTENILFSKTNDSLLQFRQNQQSEGQRFLRFTLTNEINGLISLEDLQGVIEVQLPEILPVPEIPDFWLGMVNWQGEATWILDLAGFLGNSHWTQREKVAQSGIAMLIEVDQHKVGLLVENVNGIENYDPQSCLPVSHQSISPKLSSLIQGYFLDRQGNSLMLLNVSNLIDILQL